MGTFTCLRCKQEKEIQTSGGTGYSYSRDNPGEKTCYECCAEVDKEWMRTHDKITLYLSMRQDPNTRYEATNWPGTLRLPVHRIAHSVNNWGAPRVDAWFYFEGCMWHGTQLGNYTQILRCKRNKGEKP